MPCYHFTYHGYGTWLPDEDDGYVRRGMGQLPQDVRVADEYRQCMKSDVALFEEPHQQALIDEVHVAAGNQDFRVHFVATEPTYIHVLVSWKDDRPWLKLRTAIKSSRSRRLNRDFAKRPWLSEGASRRRVVNQEHSSARICRGIAGGNGARSRDCTSDRST